MHATESVRSVIAGASLFRAGAAPLVSGLSSAAEFAKPALLFAAGFVAFAGFAFASSDRSAVDASAADSYCARETFHVLSSSA